MRFRTRTAATDQFHVSCARSLRLSLVQVCSSAHQQLACLLVSYKALTSLECHVSGLKRLQTKRQRRRPGTPPPVPRQRVQPIRPERLSQIEAERPAISDLGLDAPKRLRRHVAERRRDELVARRPIRREAPPLVTLADPRPLPEVLGIVHWEMRNCRPEFSSSICEDENASLDNLRQAVELLEDIDSISSRVFGARHPDTAANGSMLSYAREKLAQAEAPVARRTRSKAEES